MDSVIDNPQRLRDLRRLAEHCKIRLSSQDTCTVTIPSAGASAKELTITMSQGDLEAAAEPFLQQLWIPLERLAREHHLEYAQYPYGGVQPTKNNPVDRFAPPPRVVTQLLLVGGATQAPAIQAFLERITGCKRCTLDVNPEQCVAIGAALHAGVMVGEVRAGIEMADSIYVQDLQSRTTGFQM